MTPQLTILFTPIEAHGHINASIGVAQVLKSRGHRIFFTLGPLWAGKLNKYGFEEVILSTESVDQNNNVINNNNQMKSDVIGENESDLEYWPQRIAENAKVISSGDSISIMKNFWVNEFSNLADFIIKHMDSQYQDAINCIKPDLIVNDNYIILPSIVKSGIPWVWLASPNPLFVLTSDKTPPSLLGLPINSDKNEWKKLQAEINSLHLPIFEKCNKWLIENHGMKPLKVGPPTNLNPPSPWANIYMMPREIDYTDVRDLPDKWFGFDNLMRHEDDGIKFEIPRKLVGKQGKLVYVSMGTIGCADLSLMRRLVGIIGKSKHRFIFSKGPYGHKYDLAQNMWGENCLPQTKIIPIVDLVITHGGNNTVTESFYFGKPMIVMPIFNDQFDNAQRIHEKGLGIRISPYKCTQQELLDTINKIVDDKKLAMRMNEIGKRIRASRSVEKLADLLEKQVKHRNE